MKVFSWYNLLLIMVDISLGQIEEEKEYNFKSKYDEDGNIFIDEQNCKYFEIFELKNEFVQRKNSFSCYSHNIRSINGHWDDILDIMGSVKPIKFSVLAFQEIWSISRVYEIPGYCKLEYNTRDKNASINPNCGGGGGLFIDEKYKDYEILSDASIFIPNVYESIWVKIRIKDGQDKIIGNVYRPNTAPLANLSQAIEIHNSILENLQNDRVHSKCDIHIVGDFNINILNFETHSQTNDYINSQISRSFIPLITLPTRINNQSATLIDHIWSNKICRQYFIKFSLFLTWVGYSWCDLQQFNRLFPERSGAPTGLIN